MLKILDRPSPNFDERDGAIELVVLHYTGMQDGEIALARLCDPAPRAGRYPGPWQGAELSPDAVLGRASSHYVVGEAGEVFRLVDEGKRAWHAGVAAWEGRTDINARSIGIEIVNGGHDFGLPDFPDAQIAAVIALVKDILARRGLSPSRVVGHSDIAPGRKQDPGEKFPWKRLADAGVSIWPEYVAMQAEAKADAGLVQRQLRAIGYSVDESGAFDELTSAAVTAFQRRFRPARVDGLADEETQALLMALSRQV